MQRFADLVALVQVIAQGEYTFRKKVLITPPKNIKGMFIDSIPLSILTKQTVRGLFCNHHLKELSLG